MRGQLLVSQYKTSQFKALQKDWYQRLKESGFEDIEDTDSPLELLKTWHSMYFQKRHTPESFELNQEYFNIATGYFNETEIEPYELKIWTHYTNGLTVRAIAEKMNQQGYRTNKDSVNRTIQYLVEIMKRGLK